MSLTSDPLSEISSSAVLDVCIDADAGATESSLPALPLDFSRRAELTELMDEPCSYEELRACLHDIARVNRLTMAHRPTLGWLDQLVKSRPRQTGPLRIVDVGCGYGDMLRRIDAWALKRGVAVELTGVDLNPDAIRAAREATSAGQRIEWVVGDALDRPSSGIDVVLSTLLTHHLPNAEVVRFLRWMEETAVCGWFINDLHRQPVPYHLFRWWARFSGWHEFVRNDGPVSIRRSFVVEDWEQLCSAAGIAAECVSIREHRPARLCVGRIR